MQRVIDTHLHCSELSDDYLLRYAKFNGLEYTLEELLGMMSENSVERGLLLSPPLKAGGIVANSRIIELCDKSKDKLVPILTAEPTKQEISEVVKLARANKGYVKGFKIRLGYVEIFPYDPVFDPLYDYALSEGLPVLFHTGDTATSDGSLAHSHPLTIDKLANSRQDLKMVICHFGNPWISDTAELIYKHQNVYADISGLVAGDGGRYSSLYLESLAAKISDAIYFAGGTEKILFGTDYPVETFSAGLKLVEQLKIEKEDAEKILYKNAWELFFRV
ncbi:MAG: amidohydrolase [Nitrososphaerota archaeon]|nr:amidohydrolase [Nitrososphaerota archaeon]